MLCEGIAGRRPAWRYAPKARIDDPIGYVSDLRRLNARDPDRAIRHDIRRTRRISTTAC